MKILTLDPALRNTGWAIAELNDETQELTVLRVGVIQTKRKTGDSVELIGNVRDIFTQLTPLVNEVDLVVSEHSTMAQNASNALTNGIVTAVLSWIAMQKMLITVTQNAGKYVTGIDNPTKKDVVKWATPMLPKDVTVTASNLDHVADAIAVLHAAKQSLTQTK